MKYRIAICGLGLMALGVATATSAQAQGCYYGPPRFHGGPPPMMHDAIVPENEVLMLVRAQGLTPLTRPARRGPRYVLLASDRMGGQLRVVISAFDGRIIRVAPAHDPRFAHHPSRPPALVPVPPQHHGAPQPRYSAVPGPDVKDPPPVARAPRQAAPRQVAPPPVAGSPNDQQLASAPATTESPPRRPARTPLPRPRPATASNETAPAQTVPAQAAAEAGAQPPPPAARPQQPASPAPTAAQSKTPAPMVPVAPLE